MTTKLKPIDEMYRDFCDCAVEQCAALGAQMNAIIEGEDEYGNDFDGWMNGTRREPDGRVVMVFLERGETQRQVIYVDAILALADLIRRERVAEAGAL